MTLAIITHPACLLHDAGEGHPERPDRVRVIQSALQNYPFKTPPQFLTAPLATIEQLKLAHDANYIDKLISIAPKRGFIALDEDTLMGPHTLNAAFYAAGAVISAVDLIMQNKARTVFCNIRPPGHHAEHNRAMGFCFFNNVAVGVSYALKQYHLKRIAIVDFDVHHGNGTQDIFQNDERVFLCSSFQSPFYPGYDPGKDNAHIVTVPLPAFSDANYFREKLTPWFKHLLQFKPELIFFSAGFDAHADDPLGNLQLTQADYVWLTQQVANIARVCCEGKIISVLEGGYNLEVLAECVPAHIDAFA